MLGAWLLECERQRIHKALVIDYVRRRLSLEIVKLALVHVSVLFDYLVARVGESTRLDRCKVLESCLVLRQLSTYGHVSALLRVVRA